LDNGKFVPFSTSIEYKPLENNIHGDGPAWLQPCRLNGYDGYSCELAGEGFLEDGLAEAGGALEVGGHHRFQFLHHAHTALHCGRDAGLTGGWFRPFRADRVWRGVTQGGGAGRLALGCDITPRWGWGQIESLREERTSALTPALSPRRGGIVGNRMEGWAVESGRGFTARMAARAKANGQWEIANFRI
jgi:hypothetical protein